MGHYEENLKIGPLFKCWNTRISSRPPERFGHGSIQNWHNEVPHLSDTFMVHWLALKSEAVMPPRFVGDLPCSGLLKGAGQHKCPVKGWYTGGLTKGLLEAQTVVWSFSSGQRMKIKPSGADRELFFLVRNFPQNASPASRIAQKAFSTSTNPSFKEETCWDFPVQMLDWSFEIQ